MRKGISALLLGSTAALLAPAAAAAGTFDGGCDISVTVSFQPPLTNTPQDFEQTANGTGICTGTFVDRRGREHALSDSPITYSSFSAVQDGSCLAGNNSGTGALGFRYGKLRFAFTERRAVAFPTLEYTGLRGGSAFGAGHPASDADPVAAAQACGGGGLDRFQVEGHLQTTPTMSG